MYVLPIAQVLPMLKHSGASVSDPSPVAGLSSRQSVDWQANMAGGGGGGRLQEAGINVELIRSV